MLRFAEMSLILILFFLLYYMDTSQAAVSLCIFKQIGLQSCIGCGLGHSIHYALHAEFIQSVQSHVAGLPIIVFYTNRLSKSLILFIKSKSIEWNNNKFS